MSMCVGFAGFQRSAASRDVRADCDKHATTVTPPAVADEFVQLAPGTVVDREFVDRHCAGFGEYRRQTLGVDIDTVLADTGLERRQLERVAAMLMASRRAVVCWALLTAEW